MSSINQRITTLLAGPAIIAGVVAGAVVLSPSAQAGTEILPGAPTTCTTAHENGVPPSTLSPLTRAAQVTAGDPPAQAPVAPTSCVGH